MGLKDGPQGISDGPSTSLLDRLSVSSSHSTAKMEPDIVADDAGAGSRGAGGNDNVLPVSKEAVDDFLASILDKELSSDDIPHSQHTPADAPPERPPFLGPQSPHSALLEECRKLMLPQIMQNAFNRNPLIDDNSLGHHVRALMTDDWCEEMIGHAQRAVAQLRERDARLRLDGSNTGPKRRRELDGDEMTVRQVTQPMSPPSEVVVRLDVSKAEPEGNGLSQDVVQATLESAVNIMTEYLAVDKTPLRMSAEVTLEQQPSAVYMSGQTEPVSSASVVPDKSDAPMYQDTPEEPPAHSQDLSRVPSLWAMTVGSRRPEIAEILFKVENDDAMAAQRWARRHMEFDEDAAQVSVHLLCLPTTAVASANQNLSPAASPESVATSLWNISTTWPPVGSLLVEVNPGHSYSSRIFLPLDMTPNTGPLDISAFICPGENRIRLVQLRELSAFVFVVHAGAPTAEERRHFAARAAEAQKWTKFLSKASARMPSRVSNQRNGVLVA